MKGHQACDVLLRLWQDRLITEDQMIMLGTLAGEFARLNVIPMQTKDLSEKLLRSSKQIIEFLEPTSV